MEISSKGRMSNKQRRSAMSMGTEREIEDDVKGSIGYEDKEEKENKDQSELEKGSQANL